jgi:hypothetical protein
MMTSSRRLLVQLAMLVDAADPAADAPPLWDRLLVAVIGPLY